MGRHPARRKKLRQILKKEGLDGLLVTDFTNVTYLTGFTGDDSYLLLTRNKAILLSDPRYTTQIEEECPDVDTKIRPPGTTILKATVELLSSAKPKKLGVEAASLTLATFEKLRNESPKQTELVTTERVVEGLREIKDAGEIEETRRAVWYAEKGFEVIRNKLQAEQTELQVAHELEHTMRGFGASGCSFDPIVAVGERAALPHARPGEKRIGDAPFVLIDWGADSHGYKSDLTRVLVTGRISPKLERIYRVVLKAQLAAIAQIKAGVAGHKVDQAARKVITDAGFGKKFGHGLGHGLGLYIHEGPRMGVGTKTPLQAGMIVTVEPGIYLPRWGGVRIEDDVLVTKNGHEVLSSVPKEFEDMVVELSPA